MKKLSSIALQEQLANLDIPSVLLGVSGGVDSMVLLHLFAQTDMPFAVAHINYNLRKAAKGDAELVSNTCKLLEIPFHYLEIEPTVWEQHTGSIQTKAREQRYSFFDALQKEFGYAVLATAHHQDDATESFFINLLRGSGLQGLSGWREFKDQRFRPLLNFKKEELYHFAKTHKIAWREDSSNEKSEYLRNQLRNNVLPQLFEKDARKQNGFERSLELLAQDFELLNSAFEDWTSAHLVRESSNNFKVITSNLIDCKWLSRFVAQEPYRIRVSGKTLFYANVGSVFLGGRWELRKERDYFYLAPVSIASKDFLPLIISPTTHQVSFPIKLSFETIPITQWEGHAPNALDVDFETLQFPLTLRKRAPGDTIQPLGMKGKRKVKKVLSDRKLSHIEKEKTLVLCDSKNTVALPGLLLADPFKLTSTTTVVYRIKTHN